MIKSNSRNNGNASKYKRLASMGERSKGIINELYSPIDATNRFINLALQSIDEDSQERQFLLESKEGIRKTSILVKKLDEYASMMEKEFLDMDINENDE